MNRIIFAFQLIILSLTFVGLNAFAQSWQAMVIFAGADMDTSYQSDIDQNILELAQLDFSSEFELLVVREFSDRIVVYNPSRSRKLNDWGPLFNKIPTAGIKVPGELQTLKNSGRIFDQSSPISKLGNSFFKSSSQRMIIYYGHGEGAKGLRGLKASKLENFFASIAPSRGPRRTPIDILWLDSCYMGNLEIAYELRTLTQFYVGSQDAEFASGSPLQNLDLVAGLTPGDAAIELATKFVESYSTLQSGSQSRYIESSSATVSVLETKWLEGLVADLKQDRLALVAESQNKPELWQNRLSELKMENSDLVDLGGLFKWSKSHARRRLELNGKNAYRISPRVVIKNKSGADSFTFAFNGWKRGYLGDKVTYPERLKPESYMMFKGGREFPVRSINKKLVLSPFGVGLDQFDWLFLDANHKPIGKPMAVRRHQDYFVKEATSVDNPLRFFATTHGTGNNADKYSGLNITNPLTPEFDMDYANLEFVQATGWAQ